ncbi:unnamed protein product [Prorocentrum cordatum]|uniref:PAS domain-containing protein n=1 Tax=Prorocentrum cordatum TaxID=2364126 RepID=A0ABN9W1T2_9DINO|nr:unnamed protein product [Polarella glacialis]
MLSTHGEASDRVVFGVGFVYLLVGGGLALWRCRRCGLCGGLASRLLQCSAVSLMRGRSNQEPSVDDEVLDPLAQQMLEEVQRRKLSQVKWCLPYAHCASLFVIASIWFGGTLPTTLVQNCCSLCNSILITTAWMVPSTVTRGSVDWVYSALMAILSVTMCPLAISGDAVFEYGIGTWVVGMGFSFVNLKPCLNAVWILCIYVCACLTLVVGERSAGQDSTADPLREAAQLASVSIVSVISLVAIDRLLQQMTRLELEAQSSRNELAAAQSVLRNVCDVVVEVDDALLLREDSPELRDMLFLSQHRSLRQEDLCGFLASAEDAAKFRELVRGAVNTVPPGGGQLSCAFHVRMKDSAGIMLEVEVCVVRFVNRGGQQAYLVGIREHVDSELEGLRGSRLTGGRRAGRRVPTGGARGPSSSGLPLAAATEGLGDGAPGSDSLGSRSSTSDDGSSVFDGSLLDAGMSVSVDLLSERWRIISVSDAFRMCLRLSEDGEDDFLPLVCRDQTERLIVFVQEMHFVRTERDAVAFEEPVLLRTAHLRRLHMCLTARLVLDWNFATPQAGEVVRLSLSINETSFLHSRHFRARGAGHPRGTPRARRPPAELCSL